MTETVLTPRDLNRATLARQMLLERAAVPVDEGVERLVGLQAQAAMAPYVGLWTRLDGFDRDDLAPASTTAPPTSVTASHTPCRRSRAPHDGGRGAGGTGGRRAGIGGPPGAGGYTRYDVPRTRNSPVAPPGRAD